MSILFPAGWSVPPAVFAAAADVDIVAPLNTENHIRALLFEAWHAGGFVNAINANMLLAANSPAGAQCVIRQGLHQVVDADGGGFSLHIGTRLGQVNYHLNVAQTNTGRIYVTSISHGVNIALENRVGAPPA